MNLLMAVRERGTTTVRELAEAMHVSAPSISAMVDRLVDVGVVRVGGRVAAMSAELSHGAVSVSSMVELPKVF